LTGCETHACGASALPGFFDEDEAAPTGDRGDPGRAWLKLTTGHRARKIAGKHQINWPEILRLTAIAKSQHEKIRRFQKQQLEQGYKKSKGISI
jgi:hypothetical protein